MLENLSVRQPRGLIVGQQLDGTADGGISACAFAVTGSAIGTDSQMRPDAGNAVSYAADRVHDKLDALKPCLAPTSDAPRTQSDDVAQGLEVSLGGFLQNGVIKSLVCYQLLQLDVLFLQGLELLGHLGSHTAVLLTPAIVCLPFDL